MNLEEKRKKLSEYVKSIENTIPDGMKRCLFVLSNPNNLFEFESEEFFEKRKHTYFENATNNEIINKFNDDVFKCMSIEGKEQLFQEVYNRHMQSNDCEPSHYVTIRENADNVNSAAIGYLTTSANKLNIDINTLIKLCERDVDLGVISSKSVGSSYLMVILHECQHGVQYQRMLNYLVDEKMPEKVTNSTAIDLLTLMMRYFVNYTYDYDLRAIMENKYFIYNNEQDSNLTAFKAMKNIIDKNGETESRNLALLDFAFSTINLRRAELTTPSKLDAHCENRARRMHEFVSEMLDYFVSNIQESEIKAKIVKTVKEYIKRDENGISKYETDLLNDMENCKKVLLKHLEKKQSQENQNGMTY